MQTNELVRMYAEIHQQPITTAIHGQSKSMIQCTCFVLEIIFSIILDDASKMEKSHILANLTL